MNKEIMELNEELVSASKLVKEEVKKITDKGNLTPQELDSLYKAACFVEKVAECCEDDNRNMSYGHVPYYYNDRGYSETRDRSPVTGRYISRGMDGMSGHSIEDRMVASLEQQMDQAKTEYERQQIMREIEHIRMGMR